MHVSQPIKRFSLGPSSLIFLAVLLWRLLILGRLTSSPLLLPSSGDMYFYNDWARRILRGEMTDHLAFYGLPGYPWLLALLYQIFGYNPFVPGFLQAALDAGVAVVIYRLTLLAFPPEESVARSTSTFLAFATRNQAPIIGAIATLGWAFFVPAQAYSVILMPTVWFVFAFWFIVWRIVRKTEAPSWKGCLLLGLLIGLTATGVATIFALVPFVLGASILKSRADLHQSLPRLALSTVSLFVGVGLGTSPCWIHNRVIARDPVFLSAHSGINFWVGNNPTANGYPRFPPGLGAGQAKMLQDSISQAENAAGHPLKRSEVSSYWSNKAKSYIATHFFDWLKLVAIKFHNFWNAFQYDDLSIITTLREQGVIFAGLYFGVAAAFALPGILLAWGASTESRWMLAATMLAMFALLPVFITERYRLVVVPGLLMVAAFGLSIFWRACATNDFPIAAIYLALLVGSTLFVAWPQREPSLWALDPYNSGWQALESNNLSFAEKKLALAHAYVPENAETIFALGNLRFAQNNIDDARAFYLEALRIDSKHEGALNNLGVIALTQKNWRDAESFFRATLKQGPRDAKTHFLLANTLLAEGNHEEARREIETAIRLKPDQSDFQALKHQIESGSR